MKRTKARREQEIASISTGCKSSSPTDTHTHSQLEAGTTREGGRERSGKGGRRRNGELVVFLITLITEMK